MLRDIHNKVTYNLEFSESLISCLPAGIVNKPLKLILILQDQRFSIALVARSLDFLNRAHPVIFTILGHITMSVFILIHRLLRISYLLLYYSKRHVCFSNPCQSYYQEQYINVHVEVRRVTQPKLFFDRYSLYRCMLIIYYFHLIL